MGVGGELVGRLSWELEGSLGEHEEVLEVGARKKS